MDNIDFYRDMLGDSYSYDATGMRALLIKKEIQQDNGITLEPGEIPLGFMSLKYIPNNLVILRLDLKSPLFLLVLGKPRTGKGVATAYMAEQLFYKTGAKILSFDSAKELFTHRLPFAYDQPLHMQKQWDSFFSQFGLKRRGFKMYEISPKFLGEMLNVDKQFAFSYLQVKEFHKRNPQEAKIALTELIAGDAGSATQVLISRTLNNDAVSSWQGFYNEMLRLRKGISRDDPLKSKVSSVFSGLMDCMENGYLSDDPKDYLDILSIVRDYEWINFVGQLRGVENDNNDMVRYNAYVKLYFQIILTDLRRYKEGANDAKIRTPITIYAPEVDSAIPKNGTSSLKQLFSSFVLKYGKWGVNSISDVQDSDKIDPSIAKNCAILASKAEGGNLSTIRDKGVNDAALDIIEKMPTRQKTSVGTTASLFSYVGRRLPNRDESGSVDTIPLFAYLFPSTSQFYEEGKVYNISKSASILL